MSKSTNSYADQLHDVETLLKSVMETEAELPGVSSFKTALESAYAKAVEAMNRKEALAISAQEATLHMYAAFKAYRKAATSLRYYIKGVLGHNNENLLRYGIKPIRKRSPPFVRRVNGAGGLTN